MAILVQGSLTFFPAFWKALYISSNELMAERRMRKVGGIV